MREYIEVADVAQKLGRPVRNVRKLLERGALPGVKIGKSWLINADRLERLLNGDTSDQAPPAEARLL